MSKDQERKLQTVDSKLNLYANQSSHHKDQLSRLSEAIDRFRSDEKLDEIAHQNSLDIRVNEIRISVNSQMNTQSDETSPTKGTVPTNKSRDSVGAGLWRDKAKPAAMLANPFGSAIKTMKSLSKSKSNKKLKEKEARKDTGEVIEDGQESLPLYNFNDNLDLNSFL